MNRAAPANNTSGEKGVSWYKPSRKWRAKITANGKQIHIGHFDSFDDAVVAYKNAQKKYHGEFCFRGTR